MEHRISSGHSAEEGVEFCGSIESEGMRIPERGVQTGRAGPGGGDGGGFPLRQGVFLMLAGHREEMVPRGQCERECAGGGANGM